MESRAKKQLRIRSGANGLDGPIRVLEVVGNATVGGMETYVRNLIRQLPSTQFEVTCICPYESPFTTSLRQLGCTVYTTPIEDDPRWRSIQLAAEVIRLHHIDVAHAHMPKAHALAGLAGNLTDIPVMATVHGMNITTHELGIWRTTGSHLITVCQEAYTQALAMGVPPDRLSLIQNGVDLDLFTPDRDGVAFRQTVGIPLDAPLVGFVGRLEHEKGPDFFVRAAHEVHRWRPEAHFALVGQGAMQGELERMIRDMGLTDHVHLAGKWTNPAEVYPAFDILVQTSRSEGMPLVLLEGMACGCPIVAYIVGGVRELVENESSGLIVSPNHWEGVAARVLDLLAQPELMRQMGRAARHRAETLFDLKLSVQRTTDLFRQLVVGEPARQYRSA